MPRWIASRRCWPSTGMSIATTCRSIISRYSGATAYWNKTHFIRIIKQVSAMKTTTNYLVMCLSVLAGISLLWVSCQKEEFTQTTDTTPNISTFLANSADYSIFSEVIHLAGAASYLDAWGTYTVFAPDNAAMEAYLQAEGVGSVGELSEA